MKNAFLGILLLTATAAFGQIVTASLDGTVLDPAGAVVRAAKVKVVNTSTNLEVQGTSNDDGRFSFPSLPPGGPYTVTVEAAGFSTEEQTGLTLEVNQAARLDFHLKIGAASETVRVTAEAPLIEPGTATMGQVINTQAIVNLPLNQRNAYSLVFLAPGVTGSVSNQYNSANISINGGRPGSTDILVDGIPSSPPLANPIEGLAVFPSVDSVQEFKVQTNTYSAEFGRAGSGIINLIYKSGTNQFHGSAFEFLRNSDLDANGFFANKNGTPLPNFKRNQFGATLGGPVELPKIYHGRDKTFFFFGYEGLRQGSASNLNTTVPTALQRAGDFSKTLNAAGQQVVIYDPTTTTPSGTGYVRQPFPGNVIPANRIDRVAKNIVNYYPQPNLPGAVNSGLNNYFVSSTSLVNTNQIDAKVDEVVNDKSRFFVRYSRRGLQQPAPAYFPADIRSAQNNDSQPQTSNSAAIDYTRTISPTDLLEVRYGFARTKLNFASLSLGFDPTSLGFPSYIAANADHLLFPGIAPANYYTLGGAAAGDTRDPGFESHLLGVSNTHILGSHTLRIGVEGRLMRVNDTESGSSTGNFSFSNAITQGPNPNAATSTAGNSIASLLLGVGSGSMTISSKDVATQSTYYAAYLQDDWKVSRKLTLNLGVRYDLDIPRTERYNRMETFDPTVASPLAAATGIAGLHGGVKYVGVNGYDRRQYDPEWNNVGPRVGFAYQVGSKTVIRGGYGLFYAGTYRGANSTVGTQGFSAVTNYVGSPDGLTPSVYLSNPFPNGLNKPSGSSQGLLSGIGSTFATPLYGDNRVPYTQNWDLNLQRELPGNILLDAAYVGSHGVHLNMAGETDYNIDQLTPDVIALGSKLQQSVPNPFYGIITTGPEAAATIPLSYLLSPFPQFTGVQINYPTGGYTIYHAFQLKVEKRFSHGLSALVSYTDQKLIDDYSIISNVGNNTGGIQNIYNGKGERSISSNDISQRLVISGVFELPIGRGKSFGKNWSRPLDAVIGGWQVNGIASYQTGFPVSVTTQNTCTNCGNNVLRPNNNGQSAELSGPISARLNRYFDTTVFSQPAPFTFGNTARTLPDVRGPGQQDIDLSLFKNFQPLERLTVQFRAEAFNLLNQVVFGMPNATLSNAAFGTITGVANSP
ncbi:MAG TPA: TonB-dependent receptor, partial [Candidatus Sulfopaludibacter sp.]|nr:TonB-dependent receptor [Candidatus Sulfopaludibacter sp.]